MRRLFAKLPDGTVVSRQTYKKYTHVVAMKNYDGKWYALAWTASPERFRSKTGTQLVQVDP